MKVLVMGGSRFIGRAVVRELIQRGHAVTVFNRGTRTVHWPGPVTELRGDRKDARDLSQLEHCEFDGAIDVSAYTGEDTRRVLDMIGDIHRFVHCSTGAVYAPQPVLPWPEETPYGPAPLWGDYGADKIECERLLREERTPACATTAIRLPYVLGPYNYVQREEFVLNRLLDREWILIPGDGQAVQQFVSVEQVSEAMVSALETFDAGGWRSFNIATPGFASLMGFVELCAEAANVEPLVKCVGGGPTGTSADTFDLANPVFPFPNANYVLDLEASHRAGIAPVPVPLTSMICDALNALIAEPERRRWLRTAAERALLETLA